MIGASEIAAGYLKRLPLVAVLHTLENFRSSALAVSIILAVLFFVPSWPFLSDITNPLVFALLMFLSETNRTSIMLRQYMVSGVIIAFALIIISEAVSFVFSGSNLIAGNALDDAIISQTLTGKTGLAVNLIVNSHSLGAFLFQSPITLVLTYMAVRHGVYPRFSLDYLMTLSRVVQGVMANLGLILLFMILGEFVSRSGLILSQMIMLPLDTRTLLAASFALSAVIWFLFLMIKQSLNEIFN